MGRARVLSWIARPLVLLLLGASLGAEPLTIRSAPVPFNPQDPTQRTVGRLRYLGGLHLTSDHLRFGGWSSLRLGPDGTRVTAISDEGMWLTARIDLFFFQAEDGIRGATVTGVQTCALPI